MQSLRGGGMDFGTRRTAELLAALGDPQNALKIIHVAGTNGKGSVSEYIARILAASGKRTGMFTSPYVSNFAEQFSINCAPAPQKELAESLEIALSEGQKRDATSFEVQTAAAFGLFKRLNCEYAVIECGLGGTFDATNAVRKKQLALIASIGLEHTAYLGNTIEEICAHKAGIAVGCPAIVSALQPPEAREYFKNRSFAFADKPIEIEKSDLFGTHFRYGGDPFFTQMVGFAQPYNAALAIEGARLLGVEEEYIRSGIAAARLAGRLEVILRGEKVFVLDASHNPSAFQPLADFAGKNFLREQTGAVFSSLSDKDVNKNLEILSGVVGEIALVQSSSPRAMAMDRMYNNCRPFKRAYKTSGVGEAIAALSHCKNIIICGTFTILKEAREWIENA